jgi:hypothetical protein
MRESLSSILNRGGPGLSPITKSINSAAGEKRASLVGVAQAE